MHSLKQENLNTMTMEDLIRNLQMYELKLYQDQQMTEPHEDKNLVIKNTQKLENDDDDMVLLTQWFQKMIRKSDLQEKDITFKSKAI